MSEKYTFKIAPTEAGARMDKFLSEQLQGKTRSLIQNYILSGNVLVNKKAVAKNYKLKNNDEVEVTIPAQVEIETKAENIPLDIVYEDEYLLVVNKPKGMVVHPAVGNYEGTMVNALLYHCENSLSRINGALRPGIVHRIDKDTSGLLIVAKTDEAHEGLAEQIKEHKFSRVYQTVVYGNVKEDFDTINKPIGRHPVERKKMAVVEKNSKEAITHFEVIKRFGTFTHLKVKLETGRTHQIRVHMASIYHPVAGDPVYGPKRVLKFLNGQCLHAAEIGFVHPITGKQLYFTSEMPDYFTAFLNKLAKGHIF